MCAIVADAQKFVPHYVDIVEREHLTKTSKNSTVYTNFRSITFLHSLTNS